MGGVKVSEKDLRSASNIKNPNEFANERGEKPKRGKPATRRKSVATPPAFATKTGEAGGPLPVSMRNRRVPKTSSLVPPVETKPTFKGFQDRVKTVTPEVIDRVKPKKDRVIAPEKEGETIDIKPEKETQKQTKTSSIVKTSPSEIEKLKPIKKGNIVIKPFKRRKDPDVIDPEVTDDEPRPKGQGVGDPPPPPPPNGPGFGKRFGDFMRFSRRNPAVSLIGFDVAKTVGKKALDALNPKNFGLRGGKVGRRSARQ